MIVRIDDKSIFVDDDELVNSLKKAIEQRLNKEIKLPNGPTIDLTRKSLLSVCLRQLVSFLLPIVMWMCLQADITLPKKQRHDDVIQYVINGYFMVVSKMLASSKIIVETKPYIDEIVTIKDIEIETKDKFNVPNVLSMLKSFKSNR